MEEKNDGVSQWNNVLATAMAFPSVKVNRNAFLVEKLSPYVDDSKMQEILKGNPAQKVKKEVLDKIADSVISNHTFKVTSISTAAGIPGGLTMVATVPADLAQYYYHTLVVAQKLAYLYGWPDLTNEKGELTEESTNILTLFIGIMSGVAMANEAINTIARELSKQVVKRLPRMALTKTVIYPIVKQVAKWLGINMTKETFAKGLGKAIPIVGGAISGGLTYLTFKPQAKKLKNELSEQSKLFKNAPANNSSSETIEDVEYEQV